MAHTITIRDTHHQSSLWQRFTTAVRGMWSGPFLSSSPELVRLWSSPPVAAGVSVTVDSALTVSSFISVVTLIGDSFATLPLAPYERSRSGGKQRADDHDLFHMLHSQANDEMTACAFRGALIMNTLTTGQGFAEIQRNGGGRPVALWPIETNRVTPIRVSGALKYRVTNYGMPDSVLDKADVLHLHGPSTFDGLFGLDQVYHGREALGVAIAAERYGARYFSNGAALGGVLSPGEQLTEAARKNLVEALNTQHQGVERAHRWLLAPTPGTTFTPTTFNPRDSQAIETREMQVREICRRYKVPSALVSGDGRVTWDNYEQAQQQFLGQCLQPLLIAFEQQCNMKLLSRAERRRFNVEHSIEGFLRSDVEKRGAFYTQMLTNGAMTINEVRRRENLPDVPNGDRVRVPMNTEFLAEPEQEPKEPPARAAITLSAHRDLLVDVLGRWQTKECDRAGRMLTSAKLRAWAQSWGDDGLQRSNLANALRPAVRAWLATQQRESETESTCQDIARAHIETTVRTMLAIADQYPDIGGEEEFKKTLQQHLNAWGNNDRLHRTVDYLIQHGVPPPVESAKQLFESTRPMSVELLRMRHKLMCAANDIVLPKTNMEEKQALVAQWKRDLRSAK